MIGSTIVPMLRRWIADDNRIGYGPYPVTSEDEGGVQDARGNVKTSSRVIDAHSQPLDFKKLEQTGYDVGANQKTMEWRWFWTFAKVKVNDRVEFDDREFDIKNVQVLRTHTEFQGVHTT